jgi:oxygen-independent coproporphyrinogen-3 oxidase
MSKMEINLGLVQKYNQPGPRYTSYPPATKFTAEVDREALDREILLNNKTARDLSLYFHIPFCETLCWFCGCTTVITTQHQQSKPYIEVLEKEIANATRVMNPARQVSQMHFGGGTPTFLSPDELRKLGDSIHKHFTFSPDLEAGVEMDPRRLSREHIVALKEIGFNRASLGVQDFNPVVQKAVHRIQPPEMTREAIETARELGFSSINVDLIYGLPFQTVESFEKTIDEVIELAPSRLAIFSYAHVPWLKPSQKILEKALPSAETKLEMLKMIVEKLSSGGQYDYIGMDHFARFDDELSIAQRNKTLHRNFQGYSTRGGADIYSFGMSAISQIEMAYWQNEKELPEYYKRVEEGRMPIMRGYLVTPDDRIRRETIMRLMCDLELDFKLMSQRLGIVFKDYFASELESFDEMIQDGLLTIHDEKLTVTPMGRLFIRNIAMRFDAYLPLEKERRFSRTI